MEYCMAKKLKKELTAQEKEREVANAAGEAKREREKAARETNAEKQQRHRDRMKEDGAKQALLWYYPLPPEVQAALRDKNYKMTTAWEKSLPRYESKGSSKTDLRVAVKIQESSLGIAEHNPEIKAALDSLKGSFILSMNEKKVPDKQWNFVYKSIVDLLSYFGIKD
jgi:hypothetical protein